MRRWGWVVIAISLFMPEQLAAQLGGGGVAHGTAAAESVRTLASYTLQFLDTPVGTTTLAPCYYNCFYLESAGLSSCNYPGTVSLVKPVNPPFRVYGLRKAKVGDCTGGSDASLPVSLAAGEWLVHDFIFTPTAAGNFTDSLDYSLTPSGAAAQPWSWVLSGTGTSTVKPQILSFAATPTIIRPGQQVTLSWTTQSATSVTIDNGVGSQALSGSVTVTPSATTTYVLTAMNGSNTTSTSTTVTVNTSPTVVVSAFPAAMLQLLGGTAATTTFTLSNAGGSATTVNLGSVGSFFTQSPPSFTLSAGASQVVTVTATPQSAGAFDGASVPSGAGVDSGLTIPVRLLATAAPAGNVNAKPTVTRVDVAEVAGTSPSGSVSFTNSGSATLSGILVSDVPWIIPQSGIITIPAGATVSLSFTIDRNKRPDSSAPLGSLSGNLYLTYLSGVSGKRGILDVTTPSVSVVTVVDTVKLGVTTGTAPPALGSSEVALFVSGVGHVTGSVGTFISDLSVLPPTGASINDLRFFMTPRSGTNAPQKAATFPQVTSTGVAVADVMKNVFGNDSQVGSLQIRSASADKLSVSTTIFNASNPAGTYGTAVPTFRSDRAVGPGEKLVLTGLRSDSSSHTNLFIQETSGLGVSVQTDFLDATGTTLTSRSDQAGAFALLQNDRVVPAGAVAAVLTNTSTGGGKFLAYATPVDDLSGDNWSVVDWTRQYGYAGNAAMIIPVAGVLQGANNTFFRTDLAITNTGSAQGSGTLRFYPRSGAPIDKQITLGAKQTSIIANVVGSFFGAADGSVGFLLFSPGSSTFVIGSRTYTTVLGQAATYGTSVPTLPASASLSAGGLRTIGSLQDASLSTIQAGRPATFRTNFGLLETSGNAATVRVTLRFSYPAGTKVTALGSASKDYPLTPNQFMQINGLATQILGPTRDTLGDLRDLTVTFQIVSGSGAIAVFTSSTDNGTGDSVLRTE